jgi:hypothetical protein
MRKDKQINGAWEKASHGGNLHVLPGIPGPLAAAMILQVNGARIRS